MIDVQSTKKVTGDKTFFCTACRKCKNVLFFIYIPAENKSKSPIGCPSRGKKCLSAR